MDSNIQPQQPPVQEVVPSVPQEKPSLFNKFKWPFIAVIIILLSLGVTYLVIQQLQQKQTPPQITQNVPSPTPDETANWKTYTSGEPEKGSSYKSFILKYPSSWNLVKTSPFRGITLSKNDYSIIIEQVAVGPGAFIFEGEVPPGPYLDYRGKKYVEIQSGIGVLRRVEINSSINSSNYISFTFCIMPENKLDEYGNLCVLPITVGATDYKVPINYDVSVVAEMDKIISTLKFADQKQTGAEIDKSSVEYVVLDFYHLFEKEAGQSLFSYITPPQTSKEKGEFSWLTGADLGSSAFYRAFLRVKLQNPSIKSIERVDNKTFVIVVEDQMGTYSQATGQWSFTNRVVRFLTTKTNNNWLIDKFIWDERTGSYQGSEKYSGFPNVESN